MAIGVRAKLRADVGVATTGLAERDSVSGTPPHAWVAAAFPDKVISQHVRLYGDRNETRARCADAALIQVVQNLED